MFRFNPHFPYWKRNKREHRPIAVAERFSANGLYQFGDSMQTSSIHGSLRNSCPLFFVSKHQGGWQTHSLTARGFSLIELLIVLTILAVLVTIAQPRYAAAVSRYRASAAAQRIAADLALAQSRARNTSSSRSVVFDVAGNSYQLPLETDPANSGATYTVSLGHYPYQATLLSTDFGGTSQIVFNGYGIPSNGGAVVVQAGNASNTVTIDSTTGMTSIQ
jgi:prepilin-type N-terminal cleavage/methylation domain-containing protein